MLITMPKFSPLSVGDVKLKSLFETTANFTSANFTIISALPETRKIFEELNRKFPINERKEFIEKSLLSKLPNNIWGTKELEFINSEIFKEVKKRIKLSNVTVGMYLFCLNILNKNSNLKEEEWLSYIEYLKDYKLISIFLEIASVFDMFKRRSSENYKKINLRRRYTTLKHTLKEVDDELKIYTMLLIRIYSITKKLLMGRVEEAFKESKYLSLERIYIV